MYAMIAAREYESEVTQMLRELLQRRPQIVDSQQRGRALWWDVEVDLEEQRRYRESTVPQKGYVYR